MPMSEESKSASLGEEQKSAGFEEEMNKFEYMTDSDESEEDTKPRGRKNSKSNINMKRSTSLGKLLMTQGKI